LVIPVKPPKKPSEALAFNDVDSKVSAGDSDRPTTAIEFSLEELSAKAGVLELDGYLAPAKLPSAAIIFANCAVLV